MAVIWPVANSFQRTAHSAGSAPQACANASTTARLGIRTPRVASASVLGAKWALPAMTRKLGKPAAVRNARSSAANAATLAESRLITDLSGTAVEPPKFPQT